MKGKERGSSNRLAAGISPCPLLLCLLCMVYAIGNFLPLWLPISAPSPPFSSPPLPLPSPPLPLVQEAATRRKNEMEEWELKRKMHEKPSDLEQVCLVQASSRGVHIDRHTYAHTFSKQ